MKRLTYKKVFSKYNVSTSDKLARLSYSLYKKTRLLLANKFPLHNINNSYKAITLRKGYK